MEELKKRLGNVFKMLGSKKFLMIAGAVLLLKVTGWQAVILAAMYLFTNSFEKFCHIKYGKK